MVNTRKLRPFTDEDPREWIRDLAYGPPIREGDEIAAAGLGYSPLPDSELTRVMLCRMHKDDFFEVLDLMKKEDVDRLMRDCDNSWKPFEEALLEWTSEMNGLRRIRERVRRAAQTRYSGRGWEGR
ncbi:hypothetical protein CMUS01_02886 [Colletotrichum musicola]|uniref:Uncharacterized protein n=1 Tax=Colletotrichum musicola TaxID=2175873 RepID=A0A8H6NU43_9PEZI|nr:hypothetical protein CMUS01_02886 [Colletotrichum musicola]